MSTSRFNRLRIIDTYDNERQGRSINVKADKETETAIKAVVEGMWQRYAQKDLEGFSAYWTDDPDLIAIGTDADEIRFGLGQLRDGMEIEFDELAGDVNTTIDWLGISAAGTVAWSATKVMLEATVKGNHVTLPTRMTNVYEKRDGKWYIMQMHLSVPASGE